MNAACNRVVRAILDADAGDEHGVRRAAAAIATQRADLAVDAESTIFFEHLLLVCNHELHPEVDKLSGFYAGAWTVILKYVEDAGWRLTDPPFTVTG
ncbi:unnamed protein product [Phaeothamnion confervicola]